MLRRLEWRVRHAVETVLTGQYRSAFRGRGMEFDQVVKYEFGDDVRDIDWNVTARLGEPYRKKFVEEREISILLLFEDTPALQFGSAGRTRRETLLELAALLMLMGAVNRDRVGLLYASPAGFWFRRPLPGRQTILHSASELLGQPAPALDGGGASSLPWKFILQAVPRHSVIVWLGAFTPGREPEGWSACTRRYQLLGFRADDPWDRELPPSVLLPAYDPTVGRIVHIDTGSSRQRRAHAEWTTARDAYFTRLFPKSSDRLAVRTDQSVFDEMVAFFHRRAPAGGSRKT
ncbi:DUF58 domain-containing protein [Opitutales bacterium ASA1]|nr:DUF58 domain-containing protein [Opitutales bacterium ASA1]